MDNVEVTPYVQPEEIFPTSMDDNAPVPMEDLIDTSPKKKVTSDDVFYAAVLEGKDPVNDYKMAKEEISRNGTSTLVTEAKAKWQKENDAATQATITQMMVDESIDPVMKKTVLSSYVMTGYIPSALREKSDRLILVT